MATPYDIITGTITLTNGSASFTGVGTSWIADDIREGDTIVYLAGGMGWMPPIIASVTSDTAGTLIAPWEGPTLTGVAYRIRYYWDSGRVAAQSRNLVQQLGNGNIQSLATLTGPGVATFNGPHSMEIKPISDFINGVAYNIQVDTLADRAAYDGQSAGYAVLVSDVGDGRSAVYSKASNTVADWTDPAYVTGPGSTVPGPPGVTPRGPYNGATVYAVSDIATFNGSSFRKITTAGAGNAPSSATPPVDNTNWEVFAAKGTNGAGTVQAVVAGTGINVDNTDPTNPVVNATSTGGGEISNLGLAFSVASSAMTIALKQADGTTNPAAGSGSVRVKMRSTTLASGAVVDLSASSAQSIVIPSTATMGRTSALNGHLYHYLINNAGTLELAVSGKFFGKSGIVSTTALGTGSDSYDVMYSTTARTNVAFICIGRSIDTQTVAGTWAAVPTTVDIGQVNPFPVGFYAYMGGNMSVANNTATKLNLNTVEFDNGNFFNTSNNSWTPPAGRYSMIGAARIATGADQTAFWITLYKNGVAYKEFDFTQLSGAGDQKVTGGLIVEANGSDYFTLIVQHTIGGARNVYGTSQYTSLQGFRIDA